MDVEELRLRQEIIAQARWMNASGLNQGTAGNISARHGGRMLISPSAIPYDDITPEMIAAIPLDGAVGDEVAWEGPKKPSVEWRFHLAILRQRPEVMATVHTHSTYATALAIVRKPIPACHYMVAAFGGDDVPVAGYARYGTAALSEAVLSALQGRSACLMANHGMLATGPSLARAMWAAVELETLARQYWHALQIGEPVLLTPAELAEVRAGFATYGKQD